MKNESKSTTQLRNIRGQSLTLNDWSLGEQP